MRSCSTAQPSPTRTPRRMTVSRCTPVRRSTDRMEHPSVSAAMMATCLSKGRMFTGPIRLIAGRTPRFWKNGAESATFARQVVAEGPNPKVMIGTGAVPAVSVPLWFEAPDSDRDFRRRKTGRPTVRRASKANRLRAAAFPSQGRSSGPSCLSSPRAPVGRTAGLETLLAIDFTSSRISLIPDYGPSEFTVFTRKLEKSRLTAIAGAAT